MKLIQDLENFDWSLVVDRDVAPSPEILAKVQGIIARIKSEGLNAVLEYARTFDNLQGELKLSEEILRQKAEECPEEVRVAIRQAIVNVRNFHQGQMEKSWRMDGADGEVLGQTIRPLRRVGLYVPGGAGSYPSTVIMNAVPAIVAGVEEIAVVTPCASGLNSAVAFALVELGLFEVYQIGGAQAVAMLAHGCEGISRVDKIVGPANVWAALAKKEVFGIVDIDMIAGPSEILCLFDESAPADWIAADLLSQAEHGSGFEAAIGVTPSLAAAKAVIAAVNAQVEASPKKEILQKALHSFGFVFVTKDMEEAIQLSNRLAPEHLEVMTENCEEVADRMFNAGAVFVGPWSSEPVGDYFAGPNHVLPTSGTARFASPLGVYDFIKKSSYIRYSESAMRKWGPSIAALADAEGFFHHAAAIRIRL